MITIITDPNLLGQHSTILKPNELKTYKSVISKMKDFVVQNNGLGLAAPQVGIFKTFFIILLANKPIVVFNPIVLKASKETIEYEESCFSCPGVARKMRRSKEIKVEYYDSLWRKKKQSLIDLSAIVFQHELDHLQGRLIVDVI